MGIVEVATTQNFCCYLVLRSLLSSSEQANCMSFEPLMAPQYVLKSRGPILRVTWPETRSVCVVLTKKGRVFKFCRSLVTRFFIKLWLYLYFVNGVHNSRPGIRTLAVSLDQLHCKYIQFFIASTFHCNLVVRFTIIALSSPR